MPKSYCALADHGGVPHSTLHRRAQGRRSLEQKAESQQYLTPWEERALLKFLLQMADFGQPVRIKFVPSLAFSFTHQRRTDHSSLQAGTGRRLSRSAIQYFKREELGH